MHFRIQLIAIASSILLLGMIIELLRRKKLKEEYSLLWLLAGITVLVFSLHRPLVAIVAKYMGVSYAPAALFAIAGLFGLLLAIHFSIIVSELTHRVRILAQQNALLHLRLSDMGEELCRITGKQEADI